MGCTFRGNLKSSLGCERNRLHSLPFAGNLRLSCLMGVVVRVRRISSLREVFFECVCSSNIFATFNLILRTSRRCRQGCCWLILVQTGLCEGASESREFECVAQQMAVALAPQSAANLPSMHLALWLDFSRGRKKCREQIGRISARGSTRSPSCNFGSASRSHGVLRELDVGRSGTDEGGLG